MSTNPMTRHITRTYRAATTTQLIAGLGWYDEAHDLAHSLDPRHPDRAAGVIAALSPQLSWTRNVELATIAYHDRPSLRGCLPASIAKADRILAGAAPLTVLGGPKVRSFYRNITGDHDAVTVDRHAYDVAVNRKTDDRARQALARKGEYDRIADLYRRAATILTSVTPAQVQAVTWTVWRERWAWRTA